MTVTYSRKCYIFVCASCGGLTESKRSDEMTCSPACRVDAHRSGAIRMLRALAERMDIKPASILHAKAIQALRPDLGEKMQSGELNLYQATQQCREAFARAVDEAILRADQ